MNVQAFYQLLAIGIIVIVAMQIDCSTSGKPGKEMGDPRPAFAQIRMRLSNLTSHDGKVAADLPARKYITEEMPLRDVQAVSGVSEAMVFKVAKKLGFADFREFREDLVDYYSSGTAALRAEIPEDDPAGAIVQKVFRSAKQAPEETSAILDLVAFERAAVSVPRWAVQLLWSGQIGPDRPGHGAQVPQNRAWAFDDVHLMMISASVLGPHNTAIALSHPGSTTAVLGAIVIARCSGARTVAVTNCPDSPVARVVDVVLYSTAQNNTLLGENATARIALLNLLETLFVAMAQKNRKTAEQNLSRTMRAVQSKHRS